MTLRKITIDNSVKYIPATNKSLSGSSHNYKPKTVSSPGKQNKKLSRNNKKFVKDIVLGEGFRIPKCIVNC